MGSARSIWIVAALLGLAAACGDDGSSDDVTKQTISQAPLAERVRIVGDSSQGHTPGFIGLWEDGDIRTLGSEAFYISAAISPDGRHIAALAQVGADYSGEALHVINIETGHERVLPVIDHGGLPAWAPDSSAVAVAGSEVLLISPDGDVLAREASSPDWPDGPPRANVLRGWSPDSAEFAFVTGQQLVLLSAQNGEARSVPLGDVLGIPVDSDDYIVVWHWDSPTSLVVAEGVVDGFRDNQIPIASVSRSFEPDEVRMLDQFPAVYGLNLPPTAGASHDAISAEFGENNVIEIELTSDGSAWLFHLHDRDETFIRDLRSNETLEVDMGEFGASDAYAGEPR